MLSLLFAVLTTAHAHDYYLDIVPGRVEVGGHTAVMGVVAHGTERELRRGRPATLKRLDAWVDGKAVPLPPAISIRGSATHWGSAPTAEAGVVPVVYLNEGSEVSLAHDRFVTYVRGEGDDRMVATAEALSGEQREHYRRSIKALLEVGDGSSGWEGVVGLPLELVPTADPFARPASGELTLKLLSDGKPEVGAKVRAFPATGDAQADAVEGRTDEQGNVTLAMPAREGGWVVAAVTMSYEAGREHPWHSVWTSLRLP